MMKDFDWKKILPDTLVVLAFVVISFAYFAPAVLDGRVLSQHDSLAAIGQGQEQREYMERHDGERTRWNLSMFGGMPSYQMSPTYDSSKPQEVAKKVYSLFLPNYVFLVFIMLLGFYILMRAFRASPLISALGAIMWAFSSYYFIIIAAGHIWKFITLAYIPPTIAGMVYAYRGKYLQGGLLVMLFVAFQISSNHIQMSYYFLFMMFFMVVAYLVEAVQKKQLAQFGKATGVIVIAGLIGVAANASSLYHTYEYSKETMRGKSELSVHDAADKSDNGLERSYITAWSYGIGETFTLLVPNTKGGASVPLALNETAMRKAGPQYRDIYQQLGQYWGEQPGTSGPVYVGAFVVMLFVLGLFVVRGPMKWALLVGTVFSIMLSWGKNFMPLTDFFIDYMPMYNKFRTVSSILVVAEFSIPLLAILALKEVVEHPEKLRKDMKPLYISLGVTGGLALLFAVAPRLFFSSFVSQGELQALQSLPQEHVRPIINNLTSMRVAMFTADAWRSFAIIVAGAMVLWLFLQQKLKAQWAVLIVLAITLADMWDVNKRYLNDDNFVEERDLSHMFAKSDVDNYILQDETPYYRVLNLATSTFNDGVSPYHHKLIGGYHAAKLRRYQDLIDVHLSHEIGELHQEIVRTQGVLDSVNADGFKVLNMLNAKWVVVPAQGGNVPIENPYAMGNAWFVDELHFVEGADQEIGLLGELDLHRQAVADGQFASVLDGFAISAADSASVIELAEYDSDYIIYNVDAKKDELALFSEVYYPHGWKVTIDGEPVEMLRANYTLRALPVPAGEHVVKFQFDPTSIRVTDTIAYIALAIMVLLAVWGVVSRLRRTEE